MSEREGFLCTRLEELTSSFGVKQIWQDPLVGRKLFDGFVFQPPPNTTCAKGVLTATQLYVVQADIDNGESLLTLSMAEAIFKTYKYLFVNIYVKLLVYFFK